MYSKQEIFSKIQSFLDTHENGVLEVFGATASGKTGLSIEIAQKFGPAEIISVDSRQVFREFDVSSAKITEKEKQGIAHWGIDLVNIDQEYSVVDFQKYTIQKIQEVQSRKNTPILCGGTMLWLDAVSENYVFADVKGEKSIKKGSFPCPVLKIGIHWERDVLYKRCDKRSIWMFENGIIEEVQKVTKKYPHMTKSASTNFGYGEVLRYLAEEISYEEALAMYQKRTRNYVKRQLTWWRGRRDVLWIDEGQES